MPKSFCHLGLRSCVFFPPLDRYMGCVEWDGEIESVGMACLEVTFQFQVSHSRIRQMTQVGFHLCTLVGFCVNCRYSVNAWNRWLVVGEDKSKRLGYNPQL